MTLHEADYYQTLHLTPEASRDDIHQAYRQLMQTYRPERFYSSDKRRWREQIARIQEAYDVLGDCDLRAAYDRRYEALREKLALREAELQAKPPVWRRFRRAFLRAAFASILVLALFHTIALVSLPLQVAIVAAAVWALYHLILGVYRHKP